MTTMKHTFIFLFLLLPLWGMSQPSKILIVVSGYGKDAGKVRPGYEFDEFSQAYLMFTTNGFEVEVASPKGGRVEAGELNKSKPYNQQVLANEAAMQLLQNTKPTASLNAADYAAVYIVGGKGAMFDLPFDPSLQELIATMYLKNSVVAAVCHGPAALVNVQLNDGKYLIADKTVAGFCNEEEQMFGKKWKAEFPFFLEDKLKSRGAIYQKTDPMLPQVSIAGKLITGQNPYSTVALTEEIVKALGKQPVARKPYADEMSMNLVKRAIAGEWAWAKDELTQHKASYDLELIAVYGYYRSTFAKDDKKTTRLALDIMELATPHYYNPNLQLAQAMCYKNLDDKVAAKRLLEDLVKKEPQLEEAKKRLAELP
jgi:putative intracellular protease/amidase